MDNWEMLSGRLTALCSMLFTWCCRKENLPCWNMVFQTGYQLWNWKTLHPIDVQRCSKQHRGILSSENHPWLTVASQQQGCYLDIVRKHMVLSLRTTSTYIHQWWMGLDSIQYHIKRHFAGKHWNPVLVLVLGLRPNIRTARLKSIPQMRRSWRWLKCRVVELFITRTFRVNYRRRPQIHASVLGRGVVRITKGGAFFIT